MSKDVFVVDGARTPFGAFGGAFKDVSAIELGAAAASAAMERSDIEPSRIDQVFFGNVIQTSADAIYMARHVGLKSGVPTEVPALTVNRLCGSGLQAMISGAQAMLLDEADAVLAGGAENMSQAPYVVYGARWGLRLGSTEFQDYLFQALNDPYCGCDMANTAENLAEEYGISRQEVDEFALRSQQAAAAAQEKCYFTAEIVPVSVPGKKGPVEVARDEHPRPDTSAEVLARLQPVFRKNGVVTAGNASGIVDGAAAVVLATEEGLGGKRPIGRIVSWGVVGVEPRIMGIGPARAIPAALERAGLTMDDIDLIEINEAFSAQYLAVERELGLDRDRVNVNGGAIAIGHPLGASGARLGLTLLYELRRRGGRFGVASACIGGGQGIAVVFEALGENGS
ncbi:MAG TPA: acetyl-CoA C-acetyltransferase [Chloroflexota bacterium]|nr:acetyl-CoA C-acetyltransferase [Chloroflexota bacterium]